MQTGSKQGWIPYCKLAGKLCLTKGHQRVTNIRNPTLGYLIKVDIKN